MSRILIVEDEEAIAELEKDYLELNDFEVIIENSGDTGLATALPENMVLLYRSMLSFQWYFSNKNAYDIAYALALAANFSVYPCKVCINFPIIIHLFA